MSNKANYHESSHYKWFDISIDVSDTSIELMNAYCDATYETIKKRILAKDMSDVNILVDVYYDIQQAIIEANRRADLKEVQDE